MRGARVKTEQMKITTSEALNFIGDITRVMNQSDDPEQVLDQILLACIHVTEADTGSIMLMDSNREYLEVHASRGIGVEAQGLKLKVGEGVTGWVAKNGKPRLIGNAEAEADYISVKDGLRSELAVPMFAGEELIGVLSVDSGEIDAFGREHQDFLSIMSNLAAHIFVNAKDNQLLKFRDRYHRVMIEISRVVSQSLQLEDVFREVMEISEKAFRLQKSTLMLYDRQADQLKVVASVGLSQEESRGIKSYSPGEGVSGAVFINKTPEFIPSVKNEPDFLNRMQHVGDSEDLGFYCCPIFSRKEVVGVFSTFTRTQNGVNPTFLMEFLEILGSIISQAITIQKLVKEETREIAYENIQLKRELGARYQFGSLIGRSPIMNKLFDKVRIIADSRASVLLTGDSGTGKELIASAIHYNSPRRENPFIKINCAAIPENLLESELFGHRKGAFTGAVSDKKGKFEIADGGTIFLDEIGEMDLNLQSKLLRVLQEREIEPVGGRTRQVDIRVIAATNADLEEKIAAKEFRADLYYRLNVINLRIPPLRERREDILLLVQHFIDKYKKENEKEISAISPEAVGMLENYDWPGNVRQLENIIERAVVLCRTDILSADDFQDSTLPFDRPAAGAPALREPEEVVAPPQAVRDEWPVAHMPDEDRLGDLHGRVYQTVIAEVEQRLIKLALKRFRYTKTRAARFLGINRNTLDKKIKELNIEY